MNFIVNKFCRVLFIFGIIIILPLSGCKSKSERVYDLVKEGRNKLAYSDIKGAKKAIDKAVKLDHDNAEAWYIRGNIWFNLKQEDSALGDYSIAIRLKPDFAEAYDNRAKIKSLKGDKDGACHDWIKAESLGMKNLKENTKWCK